MGREEVLKQQQIRQAQASFAQGVSNGQITIVDRFGHKLRQGDVVLLSTPMPPMYQIADIQPVLDPRLPAGVVRVVLVAQDDQLLRPGVPIPSLVFLAEVTAAFQKQVASGTPSGEAAPPPEGSDGLTPPASSDEPPSGAPEGETPLEVTGARPSGGVVLTDVERFGGKE
jgi:hypothetical protein